MGIEVFVFDGDDSLAEDRCEVVIVNDDSLFESERSDDAALAVIEIRHGRRPVALEVIDLGEIDRENQHEPGERPGDYCQQQEDEKRNFTGNFAATKQGRRDRLRAQAMGAAKAARRDRVCRRGTQEEASSASLSVQLRRAKMGVPSLKASTLVDWLSACGQPREPRRTRVTTCFDLAGFGLEN